MIDLLSKVLPIQVKRKRLWPLAAFLLALVMVLLFTLPGFAGDKIDICHATGSDSNPYVKNQPDKSGDVAGHDGHPNDIIPPFYYKDGLYPGKNWDTAGQAIYNNNCNVPQPTPIPTDVPPDPTPTDIPPTPTEEPPDCEELENCETPPPPTPTEEPSCEELQNCEMPPPTPTNEPSPPTDEPPPPPPPTDEPKLPSAGFTSQVEIMNGEPWVVMFNEGTVVWAAHNQQGWPAGEWWKLWDGLEFYWSYGESPGWYRVTDYIIADPSEVGLIYSTNPDLILVTCRNYDPVTNSWSERLVIYAVASG